VVRGATQPPPAGTGSRGCASHSSHGHDRGQVMDGMSAVVRLGGAPSPPPLGVRLRTSEGEGTPGRARLPPSHRPQGEAVGAPASPATIVRARGSAGASPSRKTAPLSGFATEYPKGGERQSPPPNRDTTAL